MKLPTKLLTTVILSPLLIACATSSPETKVYSLSAPDSQPQPAVSTQGISIGVGPIQFPDKLKRPQIVTRLSDNRMSLSEQHHWAGNLEAEFLTILVQNIISQTGTPRTYSYPWDNRRRPHYQIELTIYQFDGELGGTSNLSANWALISNDGHKIIHQHSTRLSEPNIDHTYETLVEGQSKLITRLSTEISQRLRQHLKAPQN